VLITIEELDAALKKIVRLSLGKIFPVIDS